MQQNALKVKLGWSMVELNMKEELKFVLIGSGAQYVAMDGELLTVM